MLLDEFYAMQKDAEVKYGERTVVLMQVGSFYEHWQHIAENCLTEEAKMDKQGIVHNETIGHAEELSMILNCVLAHENSNEPTSFYNPYKVGHPTISYEKNRMPILSAGYTIVRYDQQKNGEKVTRFLAEVCSPTMSLDTISSNRATSNVAAIYIEYQQGLHTNQKFDNLIITTGAAVVDIITGTNRIVEFYSKLEDQVCAVQDLYRFLISHYPRELIVYLNDMPDSLSQHSKENPNPYVKHLYKVLELDRFDRVTVSVNKLPSDYKKIHYQIEFLNKLFNKQDQVQQKAQPVLRLNVVQKRNERIIQDLGIERVNYGRIAYLLLMQHCHSHNPETVSKLCKPDLQWLDEKKHLILAHNAAIQLNLIPDGGLSGESRIKKSTTVNSLMSILDHNQTHLGRRLLFNLLQNPMLNPEDIQLHYDMVEEMKVTEVEGEKLWLKISRHLKALPDIGRLHRKLEIKLLTPREFSVLFNAYIKVIGLYQTIMGTQTTVLKKQLFTEDQAKDFNAFITTYSQLLDFEALECCYQDNSESGTKWLEFTNCPVRQGFYPELDQLSETLKAEENRLQLIVDHLNSFLEGTTGKKIAFKNKRKVGATKQDPSATIITTTESKSKLLMRSPINQNLCGTLQILPHTASEKLVTSSKIVECTTIIDKTKMAMRYQLMTIYSSLLDDINVKHSFFVPLANLIAKIDLIHSYAKISQEYNYSRPEIDSSEGPSYLEAKEIRHPIIERIITGAYVTNDVCLGRGEDDGDRSFGSILFALNSAGKSSLIKAIALNIIMAQIGCYTPSQLKYKPYSKIITRLSSHDNLFAGQSSFIVEMNELRTILRQSDSHSLVILDELSCSSEYLAAIGLTVSTILTLIKHQSTFILASHIHDLVDFPDIKEINNSQLRINHLTVEKDPLTGDLIYRRKLMKGNGPDTYGILVAESLGLPKSFIDKAYEVSSRVTRGTDQLVDLKKSRYNSQIYIDECAICKRSKAQVQLHCHHIREQNEADEKGFIKCEDFILHKNKKENLIVLCQDCHTDLHKTGQEMETISTINGSIIRLKA